MLFTEVTEASVSVGNSLIATGDSLFYDIGLILQAFDG